MSDQEAEIVPPSTVLKKLSKETLKRLYTRESNEDSQEEQKEVSPKKMRQTIAKIIDEEGLDCTLKELKRDDLKALSEALKITFERDDNKSSKPVIIKKIKEALKTTTINDFLEKEADKKLLKTLCSSMDVDTDSKDTNQEMAKQICDKIQENGASMYWTSCDIDLLHAATSDLKMKTAKNTNSKRKLVDALLTDSAPEKESPRKKKKKKSEPISEDKPAIQKGVDYDNIFQHYNCTELKEYCKNKGMKGNGNKKQLIERILQYLEGDDEDEEEEKKKPSKDSKKKNDSD